MLLGLIDPAGKLASHALSLVSCGWVVGGGGVTISWVVRFHTLCTPRVLSPSATCEMWGSDMDGNVVKPVMIWEGSMGKSEWAMVKV